MVGAAVAGSVGAAVGGGKGALIGLAVGGGLGYLSGGSTPPRDLGRITPPATNSKEEDYQFTVRNRTGEMVDLYDGSEKLMRLEPHEVVRAEEPYRGGYHAMRVVTTASGLAYVPAKIKGGKGGWEIVK